MNASRSADDRKAMAGLLILVAGFSLFVLFFLGVIPRMLSSADRAVMATFESTGQLHRGEPVRIDGVEVGVVDDIVVNDNGGGATVKMKLDDSAGPIYRNARASIKWRTLLGASYAVSLERGTPGVGELGDQVIPQSRTSYQVELDEVTAVLTEAPQQGMQRMFHELPKAFADPQQPGRLLDVIGDRSPAIAAGMDAALGQRKDRDLKDLVRYTGAAMRALDAPQNEMRSVVQGAAVTTGVTAARSREIQDTLRLGASTLPRVRATLARVDRSLATATPLLRRLEKPVEEVAPTLRVLDPVLRDADELLSRRARPLLRSLNPAAASLEDVAREGVPLLDDLAPSLARISDDILPDLATRSPESGRTTYEMIGPALAGLDGIGSHYDDESTYIRFTGNGGGRIIDDLPCRAFFTDPGSPALLQCQAFGTVMKQLFSGKPGKKRGAR